MTVYELFHSFGRHGGFTLQSPPFVSPNNTGESIATLVHFMQTRPLGITIVAFRYKYPAYLLAYELALYRATKHKNGI